MSTREDPTLGGGEHAMKIETEGSISNVGPGTTHGKAAPTIDLPAYSGTVTIEIAAESAKELHYKERVRVTIETL